MQKGDQQLGTPQVPYKNTQATIEALTGIAEGAIAYATDTDKLGTYDGAAWTWITSGGVTSVNGQTGVVTLDQDDVGDGSTYKQYSATDKTKLSGIETGADVTDIGNVGAALNGASADTPLDADTFNFWDAVDAVLKKITWANVKATLKTYFDTLYAAISHTHTHASTTGQTVNDHHNEDHTHGGTPTQQLTQANTHQSPDTDAGTTSLHHTLGTGANQSAAGNHNHSGVYEPADSDLTAIAGLAPSNDDIIQRKAGAWTNRTLSQLSTDMTELTQDVVGDMVTGNTETGISVTYDDTAGKLNFDAQTAGDARYALIAKGVTNGDSHDHNGGDGAAITDANLSTSDITTNDVSTSKHGFTPKAPNDTTKFLRGDAAWAVPSQYMELISDTTLGADGTFDLTSIPATYKHLQLYFTLRTDRAAAADKIKLVVNNDTGNNYETTLFYWYHSNTYGTEIASAVAYAYIAYVPGNTALASSFSGGVIILADYANTSYKKFIQARSGMVQSTAIHPEIYDSSMMWLSTSAISRLTITPNLGTNFKTGSRVTLYGIK